MAEYAELRDADKYLATMESIAEDFRNGRTIQNYPSSIVSDSDAKAFYGAIVTQMKAKDLSVTDETEEIIAESAKQIKAVIASCAKRDWKHNEVVHKQMKREMDDCLFDMFDKLGIEINKDNVEMLDLIVDEAMKVAIVRY